MSFLFYIVAGNLRNNTIRDLRRILSARLLVSSLQVLKTEIDNLTTISHLLLPSRKIAHLTLTIGQLRIAGVLYSTQQVH